MSGSARYYVLDASGRVLNIIMVDEPFPASYRAGYGSYYVRADVSAAPVEGRTDILPLAVNGMANPGDSIDLSTGDVTPAPTAAALPEEVAP